MYACKDDLYIYKWSSIIYLKRENRSSLNHFNTLIGIFKILKLARKKRYRSIGLLKYALQILKRVRSGPERQRKVRCFLLTMTVDNRYSDKTFLPSSRKSPRFRITDHSPRTVARYFYLTIDERDLRGSVKFITSPLQYRVKLNSNAVDDWYRHRGSCNQARDARI